MTKTKILIIQDDPKDSLPQLAAAFPDCDFHACAADETVEDALDRVGPQIVFGLHGLRFPAHTHAAALNCPTVRWLHNGGAGVDHLPPWDPRNVVVTNSAGVSSRFMAETVTGAILMMNFGFPAYLRQQEAHIWRKLPWTSLSQKTVLIVGLGGIGSAVAERLRMFGAHVIGARRGSSVCPHVDEQIPMEHLAEALPRADYVCIHVPNTAATHHLVDADFLSRMRPGAILVNTSRGAQVDEAALIFALRGGHLGGAYLDVFATEPLPQESALWDMPNVVISPHHADAALGWQSGSVAFFTENLRRYLAGQRMTNICDPHRGY